MSDMIINGVNPDMLWAQHIDYLTTQSKILERKYKEIKANNKTFTWNDLYIMNTKIHHDLDVIMSGNMKKENKNE